MILKVIAIVLVILLFVLMCFAAYAIIVDPEEMTQMAVDIKDGRDSDD